MRRSDVYAAALLIVLSAATSPAVAHTTWYLEPADIVRVWDGDTFYIDLDGLPPVFGQELPVRLVNIDTPEKRSRCKDDAIKAEEKRRAGLAEDALRQRLSEAKEIRITHIDRGSFFRVTADVYLDGVWLNEKLVQSGHAVMALDGRSADWCELIRTGNAP